jgi:hypothetical protein
MEKYLGAAISLGISILLFAVGYGRMSQLTSSNAADIKAAEGAIESHTSRTEIHIDPIRDRESQRMVVDRLARVETTLDNLANEVRNQSRAAGERQAVMLAEIRSALNRNNQ